MEIFLWRAIEGENAILRGQKFKNLPKMADFGHFFSADGASRGRASDGGGGGGKCPIELVCEITHA